MDKTVIFVLCFHLCSAKITIKNLDVPSSISVDEGDIVLDCEFDPQGEEVDEVMWYFNGDRVYQWLPQETDPHTLKKPKMPDSLGKLKENIDLRYKASNDANTMYRALRIVNLSTELSGNYSCKVSGLESEDQKFKRMIIYEPADSDLDLNITETDEQITITCSAEGLYPEPELKLFLSNDYDSDIFYEEEEEFVELDEDGLFNVTATLSYDSDKLTGPFFYTCELSIPGTDYSLNETEFHDFESASSIHLPLGILSTTAAASLLSFLFL